MMIKVVVSGAMGKMGKEISELISSRNDMKIVAGLDVIYEELEDFTIYDDIGKIPTIPDVIVDFSHPSAISKLTDYAVLQGVALVTGTTGLKEQHKKILYEASKNIPVFVSHNMCLGIFMTIDLVRQAVKMFKNHDIEIVEMHHNQKVDAPSGTALMIGDAIKEIKQDSQYIFNRADISRKRNNNEIGIHSIRGGNLVGEHKIMFIGEDENIEISHKLTSRDVLAKGAIEAISFIAQQKKGYFTMSDLAKKLSI